MDTSDPAATTVSAESSGKDVAEIDADDPALVTLSDRKEDVLRDPEGILMESEADPARGTSLEKDTRLEVDNKFNTGKTNLGDEIDEGHRNQDNPSVNGVSERSSPQLHNIDRTDESHASKSDRHTNTAGDTDNQAVETKDKCMLEDETEKPAADTSRIDRTCAAESDTEYDTLDNHDV